MKSKALGKLPARAPQTDRLTPCLRCQQEVKNACGLSPARPRQVRCQEHAPVPGRAPAGVLASVG